MTSDELALADAIKERGWNALDGNGRALEIIEKALRRTASSRAPALDREVVARASYDAGLFSDDDYKSWDDIRAHLNSGTLLPDVQREVQSVVDHQYKIADAILALLPTTPVEGGPVLAQRTWFDGENIRTQDLTASDLYKTPTPPIEAEPVAWRSLTPKDFVAAILSACDASNWDADGNTGDYFRGLNDAYEHIQEIAIEYQKAMYAWTKQPATPIPLLERLRSALDSIRQYGADTLSGRADGGVDDRQWQRESVREMTRRAREALSSTTPAPAGTVSAEEMRERCAKVAETSKGYPTRISEEIRSLSTDREGV